MAMVFGTAATSGVTARSQTAVLTNPANPTAHGPAATPANGYQYTFVGNAIDGGSTNHQKRWALAIHNTHYGLVSDNVAYNYGGALITASGFTLTATPGTSSSGRIRSPINAIQIVAR